MNRLDQAFLKAFFCDWMASTYRPEILLSIYLENVYILLRSLACGREAVIVRESPPPSLEDSIVSQVCQCPMWNRLNIQNY